MISFAIDSMGAADGTCGDGLVGEGGRAIEIECKRERTGERDE
jgi:hypothetical protein